MMPESFPRTAEASVLAISDPATATTLLKPPAAQTNSPNALSRALAKTPMRSEWEMSLLRSKALLQDHRQIESFQDHKQGYRGEQDSEGDLDSCRRSHFQDPCPE